MKKTALTCAVCAFLIIGLASNLKAYERAFFKEKGLEDSEQDIVYKMLGTFRDYISYLIFMNAESYMHGGLDDIARQCAEEHESQGAMARHDALPEDTGTSLDRKYGPEPSGEHEHSRENPPARDGHRMNCLLDIYTSLNLSEHRHLKGEEEKEILPWIYYATRLNPHNITAYEIGGYWLGMRMSNVPQALAFLNEGIRNNPDARDLYIVLGQIYLFREKNYPEALKYLEKARELLKKDPLDPIEKRNLFVMIGRIYEEEKNYAKCAEVYGEIYKCVPQYTYLYDRYVEYKALASKESAE